MTGSLRIAVVLVSAAALCVPWAAAEDRQSTRLEREHARETNPKKRVKLAIEVIEERFKQLRSAYEAAEPGPQQQAIERYLGALELLGKDVAGARNTGVSKNAETHLRRQIRELENLKMNVSALDRPDLEKILTRLLSLRQEILYSIMNPPRESAQK